MSIPYALLYTANVRWRMALRTFIRIVLLGIGMSCIAFGTLWMLGLNIEPPASDEWTRIRELQLVAPWILSGIVLLIIAKMI